MYKGKAGMFKSIESSANLISVKLLVCLQILLTILSIIIYYTVKELIAGIAFVVSLCKVMKTNRYISYVGANTLIYFALHGKEEQIIGFIRKLDIYSIISWNTLYTDSGVCSIYHI